MGEYTGRTSYTHTALQMPGIAGAIVIIRPAFFSLGHIVTSLIQFTFFWETSSSPSGLASLHCLDASISLVRLQQRKESPAGFLE